MIKKKLKEVVETKTEKKININSLKDVPHLGPVSAERLADKGITNMLGLFAGMNNPIELAKVTGMDKKDAAAAIRFAKEQLEIAGVIGTSTQTADKYYDEILSRKHLKLGCSDIDNALRGGFEETLVYEIYGHEGAGKTQMLHTLTINVAAPLVDGGLYDKVADGEKLPVTLYIDTENTFRPDRIHSLLEGKGMITQIPTELKKKLMEHKTTIAEDVQYKELYQKQIEETKEFAKKHILLWKCTTAAALIAQLENANNLISTGFPIKMIIIDSFTNLFRGNYIGRGSTWSKSDDTNYTMKLINDLAEVHKLVMIYTTQVYESPDAKPWEDKIKAYGGHIVGHASNVRIKLDKPSGNPTARKNKFTIIKAAHLPNDEALYMLTSRGIDNFVAKGGNDE